MKVLVVGGAGYIGSHVAKALMQSGHSVTVFDNLSSGQKINLFPQNAFVEGDILDYNALCQAMTGHDAVVHLAAKKAVGESMENPMLYSVNNISGSINILNAMVETGATQLIIMVLPSLKSKSLCNGMTNLKILNLWLCAILTRLVMMQTEIFAARR